MSEISTVLNVDSITTDGVQMNAEHPDTFDIPSTTEINEVQVGQYVKILAMRERFWVMVNEIKQDSIVGSVNNDLIFTAEHGLSFGMTIEFSKNRVINICI